MAQSTFTVQARLTDDLLGLLQEKCEQKGLTNSDVVRSALELYFYGTTASLQGPDAGFLAARKRAHQLAQVALAVAFDTIPEDYEEAVVWCEAEIARRKEAARQR